MATQTAHTATRTADAAGTRRGGGKADPSGMAHRPVRVC
jgi:hypothetical protein